MGIKAVLLIHDVALAEEISDFVHQRFHDDPVTFILEVTGGPYEERVVLEREKRGPIPIGCALANEQDCLDALRGGADEATVIRLPDPRAINALIDRTLLRASLRRRDERRSASIGHAEKLSALGTLVAGVAHEINNPLGALTLSMNLLELSVDPLEEGFERLQRLAKLGRPVQAEELDALARSIRGRALPRDTRSAFTDINGAIDTITDVVRDLRIFARTDEAEEAVIVDVGTVIDQVLRIVRRDIEQHAVLERDLDSDLPPIIVPRTRLTQVLTNVLINALHAVREVTRPVHRVRVSTRSDDEAIAIIVSDTGPGIAPEDVERIFDPFYTTKRQDFGTGLGLSISRSILRQLGGDLLVESVYGTGAQFLMYLPLPDRDELRAAGAPTRVSRLPVRQKRIAVLVVDDDEGMLRAYGRALGQHHDVIIAADADEAIALLSSGTCADVLLSEVFLPGMDGLALYEWLEEERPELAPHSIFVTARTTTSPTCKALEAAGLPVLTKPIDRATLIEQIGLAASR